MRTETVMDDKLMQADTEGLRCPEPELSSPDVVEFSRRDSSAVALLLNYSDKVLLKGHDLLAVGFS